MSWRVPCAAALGALLLMAVPGTAPADDHLPPRISLLTFGPGAIYWQRFGHNALLVRDHGVGGGTVYNYGYFDFGQEHFLANFVYGRMDYRLAADTLSRTVAQYHREGREVHEQVLDLSPTQARELAAFLEWNARPENAAYRYDYFLQACSTRVRDALDMVTGGALRILEAAPAELTLREQVLRLTAPDPPLMLALDLILGPPADRPRTLWEETFVPEVLEEAVRGVTLEARGSEPARPLVRQERVLVARDPARAAAVPPEQPPALAPWFAGAGLLWGVLLLATRRVRALWLILGCTQLLVAGTAGLVMAFIGVATAHWAGWYNLNMAFYNPLAWAALPALWTAARGHPLRRWQRAALGMLPVVALLGVAAPFWQANLHHLLFWLPAHAVLWWTAAGQAAATRSPAS